MIWDTMAAKDRHGTRQRILEVARELFARRGYTATTIVDIAGELGTTTAALYYHFRSKAEILEGLLAEPLATYTRIIESLDTGRAAPGELLGAYIDLAAGTRELAAIMETDPTVLTMIDERLPRKSREVRQQVIAGLAGTQTSRAALIRAHAALAVTKAATLAAMAAGDGGLTDADRAEILEAALRALGREQR